MKKEKNVNKDLRNFSKKKIFIAIILIIFILLAILVSIYAVKKYNSTLPKDYYDKKMGVYGFSKLYSENNDEYVTKIDALKIAFAVVNNTTDIKNIYYDDAEDNDENWYKLACFSVPSIRRIVTEENMYDYITEEEVIFLIKTLNFKILGNPVTYTDEINIPNYIPTNNEYKNYIFSLVEDKIVDANDNFNESLSKEKYNEIIVKFVKKYNTLLSNEKYEISEESNRNEKYPYMLSGIDKDCYNKKINHKSESGYVSANDCYSQLSGDYSVIDETVNNYLSSILDIDYTSIEDDEKYILNYIINFSDISKENVNEYIDFVKENEIIIKGKVQTIFPVVYKVGENVYVRVKVDYKIENSKISENILLCDNKNKSSVSYKIGEQYTKIIDLKLYKEKNGYKVVSAPILNYEV